MKWLTTFLFTLFLIGCSDPEQKHEVTPSVPKQTGKEIYLMYCAQCHGATGDGKGTLMLDRPARSFIDGGFSFGNTVHAISKTTASGIPGTPMPPFVDVLSTEQIKLVSQYVRSFAPTLKEATAKETEMIVMDTPLVARGMIPPIKHGLPLHPRGLVIGNPDGFSYEYRVDDVRLLAIRQGRFVERADWGARGGAPLTLLGKISVLVEYGNPKAIFRTLEGEPLRAKLAWTNTLGKYGVIAYTLLGKDGTEFATVKELCKPTTGARALIEQQFTIHATKPVQILILDGTVMSDPTLVPAGESVHTLIHATRGSTK